MWFTHVRVWQRVSSPTQSVSALHSTHVASFASLQMRPPITVHAFPDTGGLDGTPLVQTLPVHGLVSTGTSALSTRFSVFPAPSHFFVWQSPSTCPVVTVPAGWVLIPQRPPLQVRVWQSSSTPGQVEA